MSVNVPLRFDPSTGRTCCSIRGTRRLSRIVGNVAQFTRSEIDDHARRGARENSAMVCAVLPSACVPLSDALSVVLRHEIFSRAFQCRCLITLRWMVMPCFERLPRWETVLRVVGEQAAGIDRKIQIGAGEAVRIFTGAPMPDGADAVIMQEDVDATVPIIVINAEVVAR